MLVGKIATQVLQEVSRTKESPSSNRQARHLHKASLREDLKDLLWGIASGIEGSHNRPSTRASDDVRLQMILLKILQDPKVGKALNTPSTEG